MTLAIPDASSHAAVTMPRAFTSARGAFGGAAAVAVTQSSELDLRVVTDEGDVVTLSLDESSTVAAASYRDSVRRGHGHHRGRAHGATLATASFERSLSVTVQGQLSAQERSDLLELVKDLRRVTQSLQGDDLGAAREALAEFGDLGSLQSFTFELTREQSAAVLVTSGGGKPSRALPLPVGPPVDDTDAATPAVATDGGGSVCGVAEQA
jgi:hypothetical protein